MPTFNKVSYLSAVHAEERTSVWTSVQREVSASVCWEGVACTHTHTQARNTVQVCGNLKLILTDMFFPCGFIVCRVRGDVISYYNMKLELW